jgi:hypothetical protein
MGSGLQKLRDFLQDNPKASLQEYYDYLQEEKKERNMRKIKYNAWFEEQVGKCFKLTIPNKYLCYFLLSAVDLDTKRGLTKKLYEVHFDNYDEQQSVTVTRLDNHNVPFDKFDNPYALIEEMSLNPHRYVEISSDEYIKAMNEIQKIQASSDKLSLL